MEGRCQILSNVYYVWQHCIEKIWTQKSY